MKLQLRKLIIWAVIFNLVFTDLREIFLYGWEEIRDSYSDFGGKIHFVSSLIIFSLYSVTAYLMLFVNQTRPRIVKTIVILAGVAGVVAFRYIIEEIIFLRLFGFGNYFNNTDISYYFWDNLYYGIIFTAVGIVFFYIQYGQHAHQQRLALEVQSQKTELAFLRSQVNPHFLFNTLNNIYTLVYQKSDKALLAMDKLTTLLRYALYEQEDWVLLQKELEYLEDFIALQRLRYDYDIHLKIRVDSDVEAVFVPPFVFIGFLENAFKHGDLRDAKSPLEMTFQKKNSRLVFAIKNKIRHQFKDKTGGIGLVNIQKRLALIYSDQHKLSIQQSDQSFEVYLSIPLQNTSTSASSEIKL